VGAVCAGLGAVVGVALTMFLLPPGAAPTEADPLPLAERAVPPTRERPVQVEAVESPAAAPDPRLAADPSRPESGTELVTPFPSGLGTFVVENLMDRDAVVVLARGNARDRALFVRSGEKVTAVDVAAGTYRILVTVGFLWRTGRFTVDPVYREFDRPADFVERDTADGTDYTSLTLTLQTASGTIALTQSTDQFVLQASQ
jgi:hypothetical protein